MKKITLVMGIFLIISCGIGASTIDQWRTEDNLKATASGGSALNVYGSLVKPLEIDPDSGVSKGYYAKLAVNDVQDIYMTSTSLLILIDDSGQEYTTELKISNNLNLPSGSNVTLNHIGLVDIDPTDLSSPDVDWITSLHFNESLNATDLVLGPYLEQISEQDLGLIDSYCKDRGIGYTAGCNVLYTDSNEDLGIGCKWGENEKITIGSES